MSRAIIETRAVTKEFGRGGKVVALQDVSFTVDEGTVFGLLGADGAGKTTLLRIFATLLSPTRGRAWVGGLDTVRERGRVKKIVGYGAKNPPLHRKMSIARHLHFWGMIDGLSGSERKKRVANLLRSLEIERFAKVAVNEATADVQARVLLAQTLLSDPLVLLLDEPMVGLLGDEKQAYVQKLNGLTKEGKTIVLSSSKLEDIQLASGKLIIMDEGQTTGVYAKDRLLRAIGRGRHARVFVDGDSLSKEATEALSALPGVLEYKQSESSLILYVDPVKIDRERILQTLDQAGAKQVVVKQADITLGDVFRALSERRT